MKIFHLTFSFTTGGAETLIIDMIKEQSIVADVSLVIINDHVNEELISSLPGGVNLILLQRKKGSQRNVWFLLKLWTIILLKKPQVLHCHNDNLVQLLPFFEKKCILTLHNVGIPTTFLSRYKKNIAISYSVLHELSSRYKKLNTTVIINGIDFSLIKRKSNYDFEQRKEVKLVQIGRLVHEIKGQDVMMKAIALLNNHNPNFTYSITFIGDGPSLNYLKQLSEDLKIERSVHFSGYKTRSAIFEELCSYDVLVQPSRTEGFGLTIIEATAAGIPVVASNIEGPVEILQQFTNNWLFEVDDISSLKRAIEKVTCQYINKEMEWIASDNLKVAKSLFSIKTTAAKYMEEYCN